MSRVTSAKADRRPLNPARALDVFFAGKRFQLRPGVSGMMIAALEIGGLITYLALFRSPVSEETENVCAGSESLLHEPECRKKKHDRKI
jgi:hypothetical protein